MMPKTMRNLPLVMRQMLKRWKIILMSLEGKKVNYRVTKRDWKEACQNWKISWRKRKKI